MDVTPKNYELEFEPDLAKAVFGGREKITVECARPTGTIRMHCAEIEILSCRVTAGGKDVPCAAETDEGKEELRIKLGRKISGRAAIRVEFRGALNDRLLGFYRSRYRQGSRTRFLATTQFEAADARRAFPCWDEPAAKATFDITIIAPRGFDAISNMPVRSARRAGGKTAYRFERTPVMSTYLVYLGMGEFEYVSGRAGRTRVRVVTTRGNKSKGRFSLDLGKRLLAAYEEYFGIRYPLPKLDLIAVPDFAAGAMENWGAITFRETILLYDPATSSTRTKQFIAEVISHEIAHQWFGNLVTMEWWNDLWLNESFATFMATKFVDMMHPEWDLWDQFVETAMNTAMGLDALKSTHPIDVKVDSPAEIREIFDAISYDKGGCVLRMLEHYVGEPNFRRGLRKYLRDFKYGNARGQDLWDAIGRASKMPVGPMVNSWLSQPGFPLVEIGQKGRRLSLRQGRYTLEPGGGRAGGLWRVPVSLGLPGSVTRTMLAGRSGTATLPKGAPGFVANYGRYGFYRVKYDDGTLLDLKMLVDQRRIPAIDRWAVQNDLYSLCVSGRERVRNYLDFADAYYGEESYLASVNVAGNLASLYFRAYGEEFAQEILTYPLHYLRHLLRRLGWDPRGSDRHTDALLRGYVVSALGRMGDRQVTAEAARRYAGFLRSPRSLAADLVEPVCSVAAWNGGREVHSQLTGLYRRAGTMEEKLRFLGAMCGFRDAPLLRKTLDFSRTDEVRSQNMQLPVMKVAANPSGRKVLWPWLRRNWKGLSGKVGHGNPLLNRIVASISSVADAGMEGEIREFFDRNPAPGTERTQAQMLERIRINSRFLESMRREFGDG